MGRDQQVLVRPQVLVSQDVKQHLKWVLVLQRVLVPQRVPVLKQVPERVLQHLDMMACRASVMHRPLVP